MNTGQRKKRRGAAPVVAKAIPSPEASPNQSPNTATSSAGPLYPRFTLEIALWALLVVVALVVRLGDLGATPLNDGESLRAFGAWQLTYWHTPLDWHEPLTSILTALVFLLFGANDFTARLVPAVGGTVLVGLLYGLRPIIGRRGALGAAVLIAFSPSFVFFSRFLAGDILAAALSLGFILALLNWLQNRRSLLLIVAAVLLALLTNVGPAGWTAIFALGLAIAVLSAVGQIPPAWAEAFSSIPGDWRNLLRALIAFVVTFICVSTGFLVNAGFVGLPSLIDWLGQFGAGPSGAAVATLPALLVYEPLIWGLGLVATVAILWFWLSGRRRADAVSLFLLVWAILGTVSFLLSQREHAGGLLMALLPLAILGGQILGNLVVMLDRRIFRGPGLLLLPVPALLIYLWLLVAKGTRDLAAPRETLLYLGLAAGCAIVLLALAALNSAGVKAVGALAMLAVLVVAIYSIHGLWWVAERGGATEFLVRSVASADVRQAADAVKAAVDYRGGVSLAGVAVESSLEAPFAWYLRDVPAKEFVPSPVPDQVAIIVQGPASGALSGYSQQSLRLHSTWEPAQATSGEFWRWLMYREPYGPTDVTGFVLYLKQLPANS